MTQTGKALICLFGSAFFCSNAGALAVDSGIPYQRIVDRNVFGLRAAPPPAQPAAPELPQTPPPKLTLTGITTIFGNKRALLTAQIPARPPEPAKAECFMLTEGQRDGDVEVLTIDEALGSVKVRNHGEQQVVVFEKETPKFAAMPAGPAGAPMGPSGALLSPAGAGVARPVTPAMNPGGGYYAANAVTASSGSGGFGTGMRTVSAGNPNNPGLPMFGGGRDIPAPEVQTPSEPALNHDEQVIWMELERERTKHLVNDGIMPPLPPTELTPPGSAGISPPTPGDEQLPAFPPGVPQ